MAPRRGRKAALVLAAVCPALLAAIRLLADEPARSWIDPDTGHRVVRLSDEPGSASLYFHQNAYTPDGRRMAYTAPSGIAVLDLTTRASKPLVSAPARIVMVGHSTASVYYLKDGSVFAADIDSGAAREIGKLPPRGSIATVNADETLLAGTYLEGEGLEGASPRSPQLQTLEQPRNKEQMMEERLAAHRPMALFTMDTRTGALRTILRSTDWLNHLQFSPSDPSLLMLCHEGPWHKVDRIWTIRADGSQLTRIHERTMKMEIAGHELWGADGRTIWYDLQTPRGEVFWLAGRDVTTGEQTRYHLERDAWSIHFNVSRDGKLFCGDGGDEGQVARAKDGRWIYLFRPERLENRGGDDKGWINPGVLHAERLVNMAKHDYRLEPNVTFTPDAKWVVFRSNMLGPTHVLAVEVARANR